jgi:hypothetical protein
MMLFLSESYTPNDKIAILPATRLRNIIKTAELFEVTLIHAIGARRSYLFKEFDYYLTTDCNAVAWDVIFKPNMINILKELHQLKKDLYFSSKPRNDNTEVTEDMISRAKEYPLTDLYEFVRGKAPCPIHNEKTASFHYNPQRNKAHCFGCGKNMDSIEMFMLLNKVNFREAVISLCRR